MLPLLCMRTLISAREWNVLSVSIRSEVEFGFSFPRCCGFVPHLKSSYNCADLGGEQSPHLDFGLHKQDRAHRLRGGPRPPRQFFPLLSLSRQSTSSHTLQPNSHHRGPQPPSECTVWVASGPKRNSSSRDRPRVNDIWRAGLAPQQSQSSARMGSARTEWPMETGSRAWDGIEMSGGDSAIARKSPSPPSVSTIPSSMLTL